MNSRECEGSIIPLLWYLVTWCYSELNLPILNVSIYDGKFSVAISGACVVYKILTPRLKLT